MKDEGCSTALWSKLCKPIQIIIIIKFLLASTNYNFSKNAVKKKTVPATYINCRQLIITSRSSVCYPEHTRWCTSCSCYIKVIQNSLAVIVIWLSSPAGVFMCYLKSDGKHLILLLCEECRTPSALHVPSLFLN